MARGVEDRAESAGETITDHSGHLTLARLRCLASHLARKMTIDWWESACLQRYTDLELKMHRKKPPELALPRTVYAHLIAARARHGDFAAYHKLWNHESANSHCTYGQDKSVGYFVHCRKALAAWRDTNGRRTASLLNTMLGQKGWRIFEKHVKGGGIYGELNPGKAKIKKIGNIDRGC